MLDWPRVLVCSQPCSTSIQAQPPLGKSHSTHTALCCLCPQVALHDPVLGANTHRNGDLTHRNRVRLWQGLSATVVFPGRPSQQEAAKQAAKGELLVVHSRQVYVGAVSLDLS